jgi:hypothetical protein
MATAGKGREGLLKFGLVFGRIAVPAICNGVVDVTNFLLGNPGTRDRDARRHHSNILISIGRTICHINRASTSETAQKNRRPGFDERSLLS